MSTAVHEVEALLARFGSARRLQGPQMDVPSPALSVGWIELDDVLPDRGFPPGIVELSAPRALGGATSIALAAIASCQARSDDAWCAWLDPEGTLYAPGVVAAGVCLTRMLVMRPPRREIGRAALKMVRAKVFEVIVIDFDSLLSVGTHSEKRAWRPEVFVRKLAVAAEPNRITVLLLTDSTKPRAVQWPVTLRLELRRPSCCEIAVRVAKDRRGRIGLTKTVPFRAALRLHGVA